MCVLPGDTWTCDTLSTESSFITNRYDIPELIDPNETSYMGFTENPWNFSEFIDSSYTTDSIPDYPDQETATPYPLIEIGETMEHKYESNTDNASESNNIQNDYLQTEDDNKKYYSMLNQLIHHLLIYKKITVPLKLLVSSLSTPSRPVTNLPLSNYHIQNYIQQNNHLQNTIITDIKLQNTTKSNVTLKDDKSESATESSKNSLVLNNLEHESYIISITDNTGNKQYLTIERYKSLAGHLDSQFVQIIPCIKNARLPNTTSCNKYYVCEPEMASIIEYTCPQFTAFNKHLKICNTDAYKKCMENKNNKDNVNLPGGVDNIFQTNILNKNICTEHGKTKDPTSESRYYICYSALDNSQNIKAIQMTCPNDLIFCQSKKVCTTKHLCNAI